MCSEKGLSIGSELGMDSAISSREIVLDIGINIKGFSFSSIILGEVEEGFSMSEVGRDIISSLFEVR